MNYTRAVPLDGPTITVVCRGRRTATAEGQVTDANGKFVAHGAMTCMFSEAA